MNLEMGNKLYKKYRLHIDVYLRDHVGKDAFYLPTTEELCNRVGASQGDEDLLTELVTIYDGLFAENEKGKPNDLSIIPDTIKINQITAMDGLIYGYNTETDTMSLYTAHPGMLSETKTFNLANTYKMNKEGLINALRIDTTYTDLAGGYTTKAVRPIGDKKLVAETHIFVPGLVIRRLVDMLTELMRAGRVVEIEHNADAASYVRHVSLNESVLSDYNGGEKPNNEIRLVDFRYTGRLYLPVVGAPLSSAGLTKVDFKDIDRITILDRRQANKIKQADNRISSVIESEVYGAFVDQVFAVEDESYKKKLWKVLNALHAGEHGVDHTHLPYESNKYEYLRAIRDLDSEHSEALFNSLGAGAQGIAERLSEVLTMVERVDVPTTIYSLKDMLRTGVYRIVTMRQSGSFYSIYATDSDEILEKVYGPDYIARFEGDGRKIEYLQRIWDKTKTPAENIHAAGLEKHIEGIDDPKDQLAEMTKLRVQNEEWKASGGGGAGDPMKGNVRTLFNPETSRSYYRVLDVRKIYSVTRMG